MSNSIQDIKAANFQYIDGRTIILGENEDLTWSIKDDTEDQLHVKLHFISDGTNKTFTELKANSTNEIDIIVYNPEKSTTVAVDKAPFGSYNDQKLYISLYILIMTSAPVKMVTINLFTNASEKNG